MIDPTNPPNSAAIVTGRAGMTGQATTDPVASGQRVWMGNDFAAPGASGAPNQAAAMMDPTAAKGLWAWLDPQLKKRVYVATARIYGYDNISDTLAKSEYEKAVDAAMVSSIVQNRPVSLFQQLDQSGESAEQMRALGFGTAAGGSSGGGGGGGGGGPSTQTSYNLSSTSDATVLVDQALDQYLGRQASEKERQKFWGVLNGAQMENPTVTHSTGGPNPTVTQMGGMNPQQAAKEFALSRKDAAEYMANTQYTDWLLEKAANDPTEGIESGL